MAWASAGEGSRVNSEPLSGGSTVSPDGRNRTTAAPQPARGADDASVARRDGGFKHPAFYAQVGKAGGKVARRLVFEPGAEFEHRMGPRLAGEERGYRPDDRRLDPRVAPDDGHFGHGGQKALELVERHPHRAQPFGRFALRGVRFPPPFERQQRRDHPEAGGAQHHGIGRSARKRAGGKRRRKGRGGSKKGARRGANGHESRKFPESSRLHA
jgi:hypothetical protein